MGFNPAKIDFYPTEAGVYLMKGEGEEVLYVGKAKNIRQRLKQYFFPGRDGRLMIPYLIKKVEQIETIVVTSEKEALLLENTLIKKYKPRYNALLKDDKSHIALRISKKDPWPAVKILRYRGKPDQEGLYFGPYASAQAARQTLEVLHHLFPLRQCSDQEFARRTRPCLLYQMKRCVAPCCGLCSSEEYQHHFDRTVQFLRGQDRDVLKDLYNEMHQKSETLEFEKAAEILKTIRFLEKTIEKQNVDRPGGLNLDAIGIYRDGDEVVLVKLTFRHGRLVGSTRFDFSRIAEEDASLCSSFLLQHYKGSAVELPKEILVPIKIEGKEALEEVLSMERGNRVQVLFPERGEKRALLDIARKNAEAFFKQEKSELLLREKKLLDLQEKLSLTHFPYRIECFDNSHLQGQASVAAMVVFIDGKKAPREYRTYKLNATAKGDDYGAMKEVLSRRYKRAKESELFPNLVIVDGGKGQLNVAKAVFEELNIIGVDLIGLAKEEGRHDRGNSAEQIFLPGLSEPILLNTHSSTLLLLQSIRDEAHRVALDFHRKRRGKELVRSQLDEITGIGPVKRKALLTHFKNVDLIRNATEIELREVKGISKKDAETIRQFFNPSSLLY